MVARGTSAVIRLGCDLRPCFISGWYYDVCAFSGEFQSDMKPNAGGRSCHDRDFS